MVTKQQCVDAITSGYIFYHKTQTNADGTPMRVRPTGRCKVWKTRLLEFSLPVKHGLYSYGHIDHKNAEDWTIDEEEAAGNN